MIRRTRDTGIGAGTPATPAPGARPTRQTRSGPAAAEAAPAAAAPARPQRPSPAARPARPSADGAEPTAQQANDPANLGTSDKPGDMLIVVRALTAHLKMENDALKARRFDTIKESVVRKQALSRAYMQIFITLRRSPEVAEAMTQAQSEALKQAAEQLEPLMEDNARLLKINIDVINRFIGQVVDAVKDIRTDGAVTYGDTGGVDGTCGDHRRLAVALNREL